MSGDSHRLTINKTEPVAPVYRRTTRPVPSVKRLRRAGKKSLYKKAGYPENRISGFFVVRCKVNRKKFDFEG